MGNPALKTCRRAENLVDLEIGLVYRRNISTTYHEAMTLQHRAYEFLV